MECSRSGIFLMSVSIISVHGVSEFGCEVPVEQ